MLKKLRKIFLAITSVACMTGNAHAITADETWNVEDVKTIANSTCSSTYVPGAEGPYSNCGWVLYNYTYIRSGHGTASIYKSYDGVLDKVVVVSQPFELSFNDSTMSASELYDLANVQGTLSSLRSQGYDIAIFQHDDVERGVTDHAKGLKALLTTLNNRSGVSSVSVIGLSMGGVVATKALGALKAEGKLGKVKSFIAYDSPFFGANVPRSIIDTTTNVLNSIDKPFCGEVSKCSSARKLLKSALSKFNSQTFKDLVNSASSGSIERSALHGELFNTLTSLKSSLATMAISNGTPQTTFGNPSPYSIVFFSIDRSIYGVKSWNVASDPYFDNQPGGYASYYKIFADIIEPHVDLSYSFDFHHSFVSTYSAVAGTTAAWDAVEFPSSNEQHVSVSYKNHNHILDWINTHQP